MEEKYQRLIQFFKQISNVPRNSCEEGLIAEFLCNFARVRGLECYRDDYNNVLIKKQASFGMENRKPIILQAHTDMVCEKDDYVEHDFKKDPIDIVESDGVMTANGTTLGADDGIGMAYLLLLLDDNTIAHPLIYCLFTTQEEIGMEGSKRFDYSKISADYLINIDNEDESSATVGCAGGVRLSYYQGMQVERLINVNAYKLKISGLYGGHSGVDIDKNRINANYLAAYILSQIENVQIISFKGGTKDNAIANSVEVVFVGDSSVSLKLESIGADVKNNHIPGLKLTDKDVNLRFDLSSYFKDEDNVFDCMSIKDSKKLIDFILSLKQGVIEMSSDKEGLVETSGNIGIINTIDQDGRIDVFITELIRSSVDDKKLNVKNYNNNLATRLGFSFEESSDYPGWKYKPDSKIEKAYVESYRQTHEGKEPRVEAIHAGVECGIIYKKMPNLEMISIGPDLRDVHTTKETLHLDSCKKLLETLLLMIEKLD